jgi:hypothetical protein
MNWVQIQSILERILTIGATYAFAKGWITSDMEGSIVTVGIGIASIAYGFYRHTTVNEVASTIKLDGVHQISTSSAIAVAVDHASVVATPTPKGKTS